MARELVRMTVAVAVAAAGFGCGTEEEAPAGGGVGLEFRAETGGAQGLSSGQAGLAARTITDELGTVYSLTSTTVNLRDIELDLPAGTSCKDVEAELAGGAQCAAGGEVGDDGGGTVRIQGPFVVDLLAGSATPSLAEVRVPDLAYQRIDFRIEPAGGGALGEDSWLTTATFGEGQTLDLRLKFNEDIRLEADAGTRVEAGAPLLVKFDAAAWLQGVGLGACVESGDADAGEGAVVIDDRTDGGACSGIEGQLKEAVKRSGQLDRGSHGEG